MIIYLHKSVIFQMNDLLNSVKDHKKYLPGSDLSMNSKRNDFYNTFMASL